ncbi:MAG: cupin domain-containing protein [Actinobacteria bacterium]|nr:cupin domain-containing protein [Actinomycetota bacterium]
MSSRRVVTGHDADGNSVFVSDEDFAPVTLSMMPGSEFRRLWSSDSAHDYPGAGVDPQASSYFPPIGGFRFTTVTFPPAGDAAEYPDDMEAAAAEVEEKLPGIMAHMEFDDPGMHTSNTTDFNVLLSGELILELDNGAEVLLKPGDTIVQNATRHRWRNPGTAPAVVASVIVGAEPR